MNAPHPPRLLTAAVAIVTLAGCGRLRQQSHPAEEGVRPDPPYLLEVGGRREQVGFGATVQLRAQVAGGPEGVAPRWTFSWRQVWGPAASQLRADGAQLRYVTPAPPPRDVALQHRGGLLPLGAASAGRQVFLVEAVAGERRLTQTVEVFPAFPSAAWPRMAVGVIYYLPHDAPAAAWSQQGKLAIGPSTFPYLHRARATTVDWHTLAHPDGSTTRVRSGVWLGDKDCSRADCHPREHQAWRATRHASILERGLSGKLSRARGRYRRECLACHTVGYQPGAENDGFAHRADQAGWVFPAELSPSTWLATPTVLKERAGVQCESCHGPGWFYTGYGDDICAQCHDHPPEYRTVEQARRNRMHQAQRSVVGWDETTACAKCHVGSAYLRSVRGHGSTSKPGVELETAPRGVTCPICHDPHEAECRRQLRFCGEAEIPGYTFDIGQGALCVSCHNGESDVVRGSLLRPFVPGRRKPGAAGHGASPDEPEPTPDAAPHAPQWEVLTGRGGKWVTVPQGSVGGPGNAHMRVPDACVGCHYTAASKASPLGGHTFKLLDDPHLEPTSVCAPRLDLGPIRASHATAGCTRCHGALRTLNARARGDYDGDGVVRGLVEEVEGLMRLLQRELAARIERGKYVGANGRAGARATIVREKIVVADDQCQPLRDPRGQAIGIGADESLRRAARNYLLVIRDGSGGLHNPIYIVRILQNSIESLEKERGAPVRHGWKTP